jgi:hypothetical protein
MTHGNLEQQLVRSNFYPSCQTCQHNRRCQGSALHPAFPHTWHWNREFVPFAEGDLLIQAWVGSSLYREPHTGCPYYAVELDYLLPLQSHHQHYLELRKEADEIEEQLKDFEQRDLWNDTAQKLSDRVDLLWEQLGEIAARNCS